MGSTTRPISIGVDRVPSRTVSPTTLRSSAPATPRCLSGRTARRRFHNASAATAMTPTIDVTCIRATGVCRSSRRPIAQRRVRQLQLRPDEADEEPGRQQEAQQSGVGRGSQPAGRHVADSCDQQAQRDHSQRRRRQVAHIEVLPPAVAVTAVASKVTTLMTIVAGEGGEATQQHLEARLRRREHQLEAAVLLVGGPGADLRDHEGHQEQRQEDEHRAEKGRR